MKKFDEFDENKQEDKDEGLTIDETEQEDKDEGLTINETEQETVRNHDVVAAFNNAIDGLVESINTERNMKIHMIIGFFVIVLSLFLDFTVIEIAILTITILLVLTAEIFNTSIEVLTDLATNNKYHKLAKKAKDISAGAVFLTAVNAFLVGYLLIYPKIRFIFSKKIVIAKIVSNPSHLTFVAVVLVMLLTLFLKGIFYKKESTHLRGGSVSGHSALGFTLATIGAFLSKDVSLTVIFYLMALLIAQSRVESKIHTVIEVILGAMLGMMVSTILFINFL
ncbi:MAG: diacylglycerol kinase [Tissierellia bacterium]|nr:diacylglycerol kinase [Tissierellia bacterium]